MSLELRQVRTQTGLLLGLLLVLAQLGMTQHQYSHVVDAYDDACLTCVASNQFEDVIDAAQTPCSLRRRPSVEARGIRTDAIHTPTPWRPLGRAPPDSILT